jgi:flagellar motor switch protein FliN
MTDMSPGGLPKAAGRGKGRDAEELTVDVDEGFDPFAALPDDLPDAGAEPEAGRNADLDAGQERPLEGAIDASAPGAEAGAARGPTGRGAVGPVDGPAAPAAPRAASRAARTPSGTSRAEAMAAPSPADDGDGATAQAAPPGQASARPALDLAAAARLLGVPAALARLDVTLTVEVGRRRLPLAELVAGDAGSVIPLDRLVDEPVDILVNGMPFARGEIVAVGAQFAVRLLALVDPAP